MLLFRPSSYKQEREISQWYGGLGQARGQMIYTPGMIITAKALLDRNPDPTEDDVRRALSGNLCRCGNYRRIAESVLEAASNIRMGEKDGK